MACHAGVSVTLLGADEALPRAIITARDRQRQVGWERAWRLLACALVTEPSLRADLANADDQVHPLTEEIAVLRGRLARDLGPRLIWRAVASTARFSISWSGAPPSSKPRTPRDARGSSASRVSCTISQRTSRRHGP